ncbi:MAG: MFS transporter [Cognatishimia sp.]
MLATVSSLLALRNRHWLVATFLFIAAFINLLDTTIVNLALPEIQFDLDATNSQVQWILVIYIIAFAAGLLPFGRFGDTFGRRRMFLSGLFGFIAASIACGFAPDVETLIAARLVKGLAAAMMLPQVLAIVHATFPEKDAGRAIGYFAMVNGLGALAGPIVGGLLITADLFGLGWRLVFLVNLPLGLVSFAGICVFLPRLSQVRMQNADWFGALLVAIGAITLLYPLIEGRTQNWPFWINAYFAVSALMFILFWRHQHHLAARNLTQLLPVTILHNRQFLLGVAILTSLFMGVAGPMVILSITLQAGLHLSAAQSGLILAAHPLSAALMSMLSGRLGPRQLKARALLGILSLLIGIIWLQAIMSLDVTPYAFWGPLASIGAGIGVAIVALFQIVLKEVSSQDAGAGSGAMQACQQIGIAIGIAMTGKLFFASLGLASDPSHYVQAFRHALWFPIILYAGLFFAAIFAFSEQTPPHKP